MAVEVFSRTKRLSEFPPKCILEMISFSNKFCCEEMKHACDTHLASLVLDIDDAVLLIEYGLEETVYMLVAACLQVFLRELPGLLQRWSVMMLEAKWGFFFSNFGMGNWYETWKRIKKGLVQCASQSWNCLLLLCHSTDFRIVLEATEDSQVQVPLPSEPLLALKVYTWLPLHHMTTRNGNSPVTWKWILDLKSTLPLCILP